MLPAEIVKGFVTRLSVPEDGFVFEILRVRHAAKRFRIHENLLSEIEQVFLLAHHITSWERSQEEKERLFDHKAASASAAVYFRKSVGHLLDRLQYNPSEHFQKKAVLHNCEYRIKGGLNHAEYGKKERNIGEELAELRHDA